MKPIFDATTLTPEQAREAVDLWKRNNPRIVDTWAAQGTATGRTITGEPVTFHQLPVKSPEAQRIIAAFRPPKAHDDSYDPAHSPVRNFPCSVVPLSITMEPSAADRPAPAYPGGQYSNAFTDEVRPGVTVRYDTEASLVEGALRDNLVSLGWLTPEARTQVREALGRAIATNVGEDTAEQIAIALQLLKA